MKELKTEPSRTCSSCNKELTGRRDKCFCSNKCKYLHHKAAKKQIAQYDISDNKILKRNIVVLEGVLGVKAKSIKVNKTLLFKHGFNFDLLSNYKTSKNKFFMHGFEIFELNNHEYIIHRLKNISDKITLFFERWKRYVSEQIEVLVREEWRDNVVHFQKFDIDVLSILTVNTPNLKGYREHPR